MKIPDPQKAKRRKESLYTEALIAKKLDWKLEFLTGGYGIFPFPELVSISEVMHEIFEEKIWLNMGVMSKFQLEKLKPFVKGIVASIETLEPTLHYKVAPGKKLEPFSDMLKNAKELGFKTSMTIVLGLGEDESHYKYVYDYIKEHDLDRITYYALRPVKGTPYTNGPDPEYVAWWIAKTRVDFPKIEIAVGTSETRIPEINFLLRAGANIFTKLPSTRLFGTEGGVKIGEEVEKAGREFMSNFLSLPENLNWKKEVETLKTIPEDSKERLVLKLEEYEVKRLNKKYMTFKSLVCEPCSN